MLGDDGVYNPSAARGGMVRQKEAMSASRYAGPPHTHRIAATSPSAFPSERGAYRLPPIGASPSPLAPLHPAASPIYAAEVSSSPAVASSSAAVVLRKRGGDLVPLKVPAARVVQMWPAVTSSRQRRRQAALDSKAPLSLQLEGFIRREHQQYLQEHPSCSRTETLFIFREALGTFVDHFAEYKAVLSLIRDEFDAALRETTERAAKVQAAYLESQSDRGLHAEELIRLKESMNAIISNQQAQLSVTQGLVHSLREQLTATEHARSLLAVEMEQKKKTYAEAQQQVKLFSQALIEETARTGAVREQMQKLEKDATLQESRATMLTAKVAELACCIRQQAYQQAEERQAAFSKSSTAQSPLMAAPRRRSLFLISADEKEGEATTTDTYTHEYVAQLQHRIDALEMQIRSLKPEAAAKDFGEQKNSVRFVTSAEMAAVPAEQENSEDTGVSGRKKKGSIAATSTAVRPVKASVRNAVDAMFPIIREWIRQEGIGEAEVEATDVIVPPGRCTTEDAGFLSLLQPVKHRHLSLEVTLRLVESMWRARERPAADGVRLQPFFVEWLRSESPDATQAKALGANILDSCQHNLHHPECRSLLLVLRGFLPEEMVHLCRRRLAQLRQPKPSTSSAVYGRMSFEDFFAHVRAVCPEKSIANMLRLRFTVFHQLARPSDLIDIAHLLADDSYFVTLLKQQWLQEVEAFTLRVVEGVRDEADEKHNTVTLVKVIKLLRSLDPALTEEEVHRYISRSCQKPVIDVAIADDNVTTHLDVMLSRFRTSVLLYRRSPEDV